MSDERPQAFPDAPPPGPTLWDIFQVFVVVGLTSFGGGASAHIHDAVVRRKRWLDEERFLEALTIARSLPGTNVSNLAAFVGAMLGGYRGAIVAVGGVVGPGMLAVLAMAAAYAWLAASSTSPILKGALQGLTIGAIGVMASLVAQAVKPAARARGGFLVAAATFLAVAVFKVNMLIVLVALVPLASAVNRRTTA